MRLSLSRLTVLALLLCSTCTVTIKASENSPANLSLRGSANTGEYRNLFAEAGYSQQAINDKITQTYQQLFHGNPGNEAIYFPSGKNKNGPMAYIHDVNSQDVRSEGMSYGMMIALQLDKKAEFDAIWNWAKTFMYNSSPTHPAYGYFAWSVKPSGESNDDMPAPDGEEYFATALYFAAERWGNGDGIYNYTEQANQLLGDMRHREVITGQTVRGEMSGGNLFHPEYAMVRFTNDLPNAEHTDPSYHLPAFYEIWARVGPPDDREFWARAAIASRDYFQKVSDPKTALTPDYGNFDGTPWPAPWHQESRHFRVDAWRSAMNWSMDWAWWEVDPRAQELSDRLQAFFESQGINSYGSSFALSGETLDKNPKTGLIAMNATASLAATHPRAKNFVDALWALPVPVGQYRYFDGMLLMMALLNCSGEYKAWLPK